MRAPICRFSRGFLAFAGPALQLFAASPQASKTPPVPPATHRAVLDKYRVSCHNERLKTAGFVLTGKDFSKVGEHAEEPTPPGGFTTLRTRRRKGAKLSAELWVVEGAANARWLHARIGRGGPAQSLVGSVVARELLARGVTVRALARTSSDRRNVIGLPLEVIEGDLRDPAAAGFTGKKAGQGQQPIVPGRAGRERDRAAGARADVGQAVVGPGECADLQVQAEAQLGQQPQLPADIGFAEEGAVQGREPRPEAIEHRRVGLALGQGRFGHGTGRGEGRQAPGKIGRAHV